MACDEARAGVRLIHPFSQKEPASRGDLQVVFLTLPLESVSHSPKDYIFDPTDPASIACGSSHRRRSKYGWTVNEAPLVCRKALEQASVAAKAVCTVSCDKATSYVFC